MKTAYFAGGCFWCITPNFYEIPGVSEVISGYSGGTEVNPTYQEVKSQKTAHRETIAIRYDETVASYRTLLEAFVENVDPFDEGGQYIDRGHSYTLAVYYETAEEKAAAEEIVDRVRWDSGREPAISIEPFLGFYTAEEYHQDFFKKNPEKFRQELIESGRVKE